MTNEGEQGIEKAIVLSVFVASPSDTLDERAAIRNAIHRWNEVHTSQEGVVLIPVLWENHAVPEMGDRPQAIINRRLLSRCQLLVATFWKRLGTASGMAESGTAEEIEWFRNLGRRVMLYFCTKPVQPYEIELDQLDRLKEYKDKCSREGLYVDYASADELRDRLDKDLTAAAQEIRDSLGREAVPMGDDAAMPQSPPSNRTVKANQDFENHVRLVRSRWEVNRQSDGIGYARDNMRELASAATSLMAQLDETEGKAILGCLQDVAVAATQVADAHIYLDGGESYDSFWSKGDLVLAEALGIVNGLNVGEKQRGGSQPISRSGRVRIP